MDTLLDMKTKSAGIPWGRVEPYLSGDRNQVWLGDRLGASKAAVTNWKARGHIPPGYASVLASEFGTTADELLGAENFNSSIRSQNRSLSKTARDLIFSVIRLDAAGGQYSDVLSSHSQLLEFAEKSLPAQDSSYELNANEIVQRLQALVDIFGGKNEVSG